MVDRSVLVRLKASTSDFERAMHSAGRSVNSLRKEIDTTNDRTAWLAQGLLALGPATVPLGAAAVPVLAGLTTQLGLTVAAAGTAVMAFNGVGDALGALNDFELEPTEANLEKLNQAMAEIGPAGEEFVRFLEDIGPKFDQLQFAAREGMFPGMQEGITSFMTILPRVESIIRGISEAMGELSASAGAGLSGEGFREFFEWLDANAKPMLVEMGQTVGNFVEGLAAMTVAFSPLSQAFSSGLLGMSESFAQWAQNLDESSSFQDFLAYVQEASPKVLDLFGSLVNMFVQLTEAAAPVGDILLPILSTLADTIAVLANTPLGPTFIAAAAAMSLYGRAAALASITTAGLGKSMLSVFQVGKMKEGVVALGAVTTAQDRATMSATALARAEDDRTKKQKVGAAQLGKSAAAIAGLAVATSGAADGLGLTNTASLALMGTLAGPWGAGIGAAVGFTMDLAAANNDLEATFASLDAAVLSTSSSSMAAYAAMIESAQAAVDKQRETFENGPSLSTTPLEGILGAKDELEGLFGSSDIEEAQAKIDGYNEKLADTAHESNMANMSSREFAMALDQTKNRVDELTVSLEDNIAAMRAQREEALRALNAELNYKASLLDARDALEENGKSVNENTRAGQDNLRALYNMAAAWNDQNDAMKNAKGAVQAARDRFVDMAVAMGMGEDKARKLARSLYEIPAKVVTRIEANTDDAMRRAAAIKRELASIDRNIDVYVNVRRPNAGGMGPQVGSNADGGTIEGPRQPYGDKMLYMLAPGEEVISNRFGQADRYRDVLKAINSGRMLADGGTAGDQGNWSPFGLGNAANSVAHGLRNLQQQLARTERMLERERAKREAVITKMGTLADSVSSGLRSDIFAQPSNVWSPGAGSASSVLSADIQRGREFIRLVKQLKAKGLDGPALAELLQSGDVERARLYAAMSAKDLREYERLYELRDRVLASAGQVSGQAAFGGELRKANHELRAVNKELREIKQAIRKGNDDGPKNAHAAGVSFAEAINKGARAGRRRAGV